MTASASLWDRAVKAELERYAKSAPGTVYRPAESGPVEQDQLRNAAEEFVRRCDEGNTEDLSFVLVSQKCEDIPTRDFERKAPRSSKVSKLWYALTKTKDLLIIKYAAYFLGEGVCEVASCVTNFAAQFDFRGSRPFSSGSDGERILLSRTVVAADVVLQRKYPVQGRPQQLRANLVAELEYEYRWPSLLLKRLSEYTQQEVADYVMGIKVYKRSGDFIPGEQRKFAAIAVLWRRGDTERGRVVPFVRAWSFGTCALDPLTKAAFCRKHGYLQKIQERQITHPLEHTTESDTIVIPKGHLLRGVVHKDGSRMISRRADNHKDLTIDLGELRGIFDDNLPP